MTVGLPSTASVVGITVVMQAHALQDTDDAYGNEFVILEKRHTLDPLYRCQVMEIAFFMPSGTMRTGLRKKCGRPLRVWQRTGGTNGTGC